MSDTDNNLVEGKKIATQRLCDIMAPILCEGIKSIWLSSKVNCPRDYSMLKNFQERLCLVPKWNQDIIDNEYNRIISKLDSVELDKLIELVFSSHIKILSLLTLGKNNKKQININIPSTKHFIHKCYVQVAREFYMDPYLIDDREQHYSLEEIKRNFRRCNKLISTSIEYVIRDIIPTKEIFIQCMDSDTCTEIDTTNDSDSLPVPIPLPSQLHETEEKTYDNVLENDEHRKNSVDSESNHSDNSNHSDHSNQEDDPLMTRPDLDEERFSERIDKQQEQYAEPEQLDFLDVTNGKDIDTIKYTSDVKNESDNENGIKHIVFKHNNNDNNNYNNTYNNTNEDDNSPFFSDSDDE